MRVALISNFLPGPGRGGAERYAGLLAETLAQRGHDVTVYSGEEGSLAGVRCRRLPGMSELDPEATSARKLAWHLREQWLPAVHRALLAALRTDRPDVVHSHEPQLLSAAVFTAIAAAGLPHVHSAHDFNLLCMRVTMMRDGRPCSGRCADCRLQRTIRVRSLRRRLDLLLAPSEFVRDRHVRHGVVEPQAAIAVPHGATPGRAHVREPAPGTLRIGFLGTLSEHKGVRTLLQMARDMPATWTLTFAGSGPLAEPVRAAAARDPRIEYLGEVDEAGRDALLSGLDVIAIPSLWDEPATLVAVEAAVRALPAVVSDRGGLPETPEAWIVRPGDPAALLRQLRDLADEPAALTRRSRALLAANERFRWATHADTVEGLLAGVGKGG